jgi:hypothetical protein
MGCSQGTIAGSQLQFFVLQLWKVLALYPRMPRSKAEQLTLSYDNCGEPAEAPTEGPAPRTGRTNYTTVEEIPTGEEMLAGYHLWPREHHM